MSTHFTAKIIVAAREKTCHCVQWNPRETYWTTSQTGINLFEQQLGCLNVLSLEDKKKPVRYKNISMWTRTPRATTTISKCPAAVLALKGKSCDSLRNNKIRHIHSFKIKISPPPSIMAALSRTRVQDSRPFILGGINLTGPLLVRSGFRSITGIEAWVAVLICFWQKK